MLEVVQPPIVKGNMPESIVDLSRKLGAIQRQARIVRLAGSGVALLLFLALAASAVNYLRPHVPGRSQGVVARVTWYLHHGQLQADAHTFVAALQYLWQTDGETPTGTNFANLPVAGTARPASPKS